MSEATPEIKQLLSELSDLIWDQDGVIEQEFAVGGWDTTKLQAIQARIDAVIGDWESPDPMKQATKVDTHE